MNYRHAFHAGNFGDCVKHVVLVWLLRALQRRPTPLFVLDTHSGAGGYDLQHGPAARTEEWKEGIGRLIHNPLPALADYVGIVQTLGLYPGSPAIIRALLRPGDRLACCELHPEDVAALRRRFARDAQVAVHNRDAWEALGALLPPRERRGVVLIDPPFEERDEFGRLLDGLRLGHARFGHGVFAAWYPIKQRAPVRQFLGSVQASGIRDVVTAELCLREPLDPTRLNGCGLLVVNPPYRFEQDVPPLLTALLDRLGGREPGESAWVRRIADE
ncbi:MAG: 23S rRNA (adenine(2030)-N(6))-methyltransferase RlmJ [Acetobacteraceae bacterium]|nr:23S rRNA (adenine(2030)-N(6))-methyltransferase RlmJ [Acetobacteraceae bacterium]